MTKKEEKNSEKQKGKNYRPSKIVSEGVGKNVEEIDFAFLYTIYKSVKA